MGRRHTVLLQSSGRALGLGDAGLQERQVLKGVVTLWHSCTSTLSAPIKSGFFEGMACASLLLGAKLKFGHHHSFWLLAV